MRTLNEGCCLYLLMNNQCDTFLILKHSQTVIEVMIWVLKLTRGSQTLNAAVFCNQNETYRPVGWHML